ncbi:hypothetical protein BJ944DRAFT_164379 [Cunninghamella echinulata]|nr:hypothetical protein BJ944DRAFT_164379 [Cunninghamella echinulata]
MSLTAYDKYLYTHGLILKTDNDDNKGRSVISTCEHKRGSVLITSQPLGTVVLPSNRHEVCNYCFRKPISPSTLQRCSQCKKAYFCDMACFKNAWLTYHQYVCTSSPKPPANNNKEDDEDQDALDLEMVERVALNCWRYNKRVTSNENGDDQEDTLLDDEGVDVTMEAFYSLMGHEKQQPKYVLERYHRLARKALAKSYLAQSGLKEDQLVHYLCQFQCNNFSIHDDHLFTVGEGTYPIASLINHSCRPNAIVMFEGALLSIIAIEDIPVDQEITIAYMDVAHDRSHRQSGLFNKYFFNCQCVRCVDNHPSANVYGKIDSLFGKELSEWDRAQALLDINNNDEKKIREYVLQQISEEEWDLQELCLTYDRKHNSIPDPTKPLTLGTYTHYLVQFFAPYIWSVLNPQLRLGKKRSQQHTENGRNGSLSYFNDPLPHLAQPKVPTTYEGILTKCMNDIQSYPVRKDGITPYSLATLSASTQLLYDIMAKGQWRVAVKLALYIFVQYCWIYPPYHPILAQHIVLYAKCCWNSIIQNELIGNGRNLEEFYARGVRRFIMIGKETLATAVGKRGEQWKEIIELEWLFLREQKLKE